MYEASRQRMGITRERFALVETHFGATAVTTLEAQDVAQALKQLIASRQPFDVWYREQLLKLHGINLTGYEQFSQRLPASQSSDAALLWARRSRCAVTMRLANQPMTAPVESHTMKLIRSICSLLSAFYRQRLGYARKLCLQLLEMFTFATITV